MGRYEEYILKSIIPYLDSKHNNAHYELGNYYASLIRLDTIMQLQVQCKMQAHKFTGSSYSLVCLTTNTYLIDTETKVVWFCQQV